MIKLKDIAQKLNVSEATVSLALNDNYGVSDKTKERVKQCAKEMGYVPNPIARGLVTKKTRTIGLLCPEPENPCYGKLMRMINHHCNLNGYSLMLAISNSDPQQEAKSVEKFINSFVDGIIIMPINVRCNEPVVASIRERKIPCVFALSYYDGFENDCVMTDYAAGSYELTRELLQSGCRKIWYFVTKDFSVPVSKLRLDGWKRAYDEMGLEWDPEWIIGCEQMTGNFACGLAYKLLGEREKPDAICTLNDYVASGIRKAIHDRGYRIPDDILLAGYDDALDVFFMENQLTTVRQDLDMIATESVRLLISKIDGNHKMSERVQKTIKPQVVFRNTTQQRKYVTGGW